LITLGVLWYLVLVVLWYLSSSLV
jgi:hypothetical protein